ncbi:hypothetical protein, partial [Klebsiella variicola]|uniref:hypothetical protein n=1 Tax=Klebsiella variicola TaxID=244366 RepID=UPI002731C8AA
GYNLILLLDYPQSLQGQAGKPAPLPKPGPPHGRALLARQDQRGVQYKKPGSGSFTIKADQFSETTRNNPILQEHIT